MAAPESKINVGNVTLSVWKNEGKKDGKDYVTQSVTIQKNYKNKEGKWKSGSSFSDGDLVHVILACQKRLMDRYYREEPDEIEI